MKNLFFPKVVTGVVLISLLTSLFSEDAEARKRRRRPKKKKQKIVNEKKLYERLGGAKSVGEITDEWVRMNLADPRVSSQFTGAASKPEKLAKWRRGLSDQICEWTEGPCQAKNIDPELKKAQETMAQDEGQFLAFADNLFRSLQKAKAGEREKNELLGRLGEYRNDLLPEEEGPGQ